MRSHRRIGFSSEKSMRPFGGIVYTKIVLTLFLLLTVAFWLPWRFWPLFREHASTVYKIPKIGS